MAFHIPLVWNHRHRLLRCARPLPARQEEGHNNCRSSHRQPYRNAEEGKRVARTEHRVLYMGFLGDTHLFRRAESSGLGHQELAAYTLCREPWHPYVAGRTNVDHHHRRIIIPWSNCGWHPVGQVGATQHPRTHIHQCHWFGHDYSCPRASRLRP